MYGGCYGSRVTIVLGATKTLHLEHNFRGKQISSQLLTSDFEIRLHDCRWRILENDTILADEETPSGPDADSYRSWQKFIGKEITSIAIDAKSNLTVRFTDNLWIRTNCRSDLADDEFSYNYDVMVGIYQIRVGPDCVPKLRKPESITL